MEPWRKWRTRAKEWKKDNDLSDADIAEQIGIKRSTVNSWFNKREPNLSDFMDLCEAMGADPGLILFGQSILHNAVDAESEAHQVMRSSPTAAPGHRKFTEKLKAFKLKKSRLRRPIRA